MWWIIGICASDADRIIFTRVLATPEQIYGSYDDFHIDYSATLESEIEEVILV